MTSNLQKLTAIRPAIAFALAAAFVASPMAAKSAGPSTTNSIAASPEWQAIKILRDEVYSSFIVSQATQSPDEKDREPGMLGSLKPTDIYGVAVIPTKDQSRVRVTISADGLIAPSVYEDILPKAGKLYEIYPRLKWNYRLLTATRESFPADVSFVVEIDGVAQPEETETVTVHGINEVLSWFVNEQDNEWVDVRENFAAYVNEDHPLIDQILKMAGDIQAASGYSPQFSGYQRNSQSVYLEIASIWQALKALGFRYSSITDTAPKARLVGTQHVRLIGDSLDTAQANCVDGSVLFASIFKKIGLHPYLVLVPGHMFVAVDLDEQGHETAFIETTLLGTAEFQQAVDRAWQEYEEADEDKLVMISIDEAREQKIMPIASAIGQ